MFSQKPKIDESSKLSIGTVVSGRWQVKSLLGEGHFHSTLYEVVDKKRPIRTYELKAETNSPIGPDDPPQFLALEKNILQTLKEKNARHFFGFEEYGECETFNYVIVGLVGKPLSEMLVDLPEKRFTLRTALYVAHQTLLAVEEFHSVGFLHRNIKPANIATGRPPAEHRSLCLINYELSKLYVKSNGDLIPPRSKALFRGSPRYASISALNENEQCRADDMWSWFFSVMETMLGRLPWDNQPGEPTSAAKRLIVLAQKKQKAMENVDAFLEGTPREFRKIFDHLMNLHYEDQPDYELILKSIIETVKRKEYNENERLDWEPIPNNLR